MRTEEGKLHMFVAIDRTSKFAHVELHARATRRVVGNFLRKLFDVVPYKVHMVLTNNGTHFTDPKGERWMVLEIKNMLARKEIFRCHLFYLACAQNDIEHRLTKRNHSWTNGQVKRINRTLKEATVKRYYYSSHDQLREHHATFVNAYNYAKRLKTLKGLTPHEIIVKCWTEEPNRFTGYSIHHSAGLNI